MTEAGVLPPPAGALTCGEACFPRAYARGYRLSPCGLGRRHGRISLPVDTSRDLGWRAGKHFAKRSSPSVEGWLRGDQVRRCPAQRAAREPPLRGPRRGARFCVGAHGMCAQRGRTSRPPLHGRKAVENDPPSGWEEGTGTSDVVRALSDIIDRKMLLEACWSSWACGQSRTTLCCRGAPPAGVG